MQLSNEYICRSSAIGKIMTDTKNKHPKLILEDHLASISDKELKESETKNKETATYKKLEQSIIDLKEKTDLLKLNAEKIHLSATCIDHVHDWVKEQPEYYGRSINFKSKFCDKGNYCESESIELAADYFNWGMVSKNTERKTNDWITGEADVVLAKSIEDIKNSWSQKTFPLFNTDIPIDGYGWQGQGYMWLWDKPKFGLVYTLMDAPEFLIQREAYSKMKELGMEDLEAELYDEVEKSMTYSSFPIELRVKRFQLDRDEKCVDSVKYRVDEIRKFISQL